MSNEMNFWKFADNNTVLVCFVAIVFLIAVCYCCNRFLRMLNIRKHGWPPPHCDADGDLPPLPDNNND